MDNQFNVPILLLVFNRPDVTKVMFESVKKIKPKYLYVAADGSRKEKSGEDALCNETRSVIVDNIDWDCELKTLFRNENLGLKGAINEAIDWFFDNEEQGIILEDDIIGTKAFFRFCELNLEYYKNDERVMLISGFNHLNKWKPENADYFFSKVGAIWGWATWKRAWELNKRDVSDWENAKKENILDSVFENKEMVKFRNNIFERTFNGQVNSWAYIWTFYRFVNSGLSILPAKNLIQNIGSGDDATHTGKLDEKIAQISVFEPSYSKIRRPRFVVADTDFDTTVFNLFHKPASAAKSSIKKIDKKIKRIKRGIKRRLF